MTMNAQLSEEFNLYRSQFGYSYPALFSPLHRNYEYALTGPPDNSDTKKQDESRKRREKKRMNSYLYGDNRREKACERLRLKFESGKKKSGDSGEASPPAAKKTDRTALSDEALVDLFSSAQTTSKKKKKKRKKNKKKKQQKEKKMQEQVEKEQLQHELRQLEFEKEKLKHDEQSELRQLEADILGGSSATEFENQLEKLTLIDTTMEETDGKECEDKRHDESVVVDVIEETDALEDVTQGLKTNELTTTEEPEEKSANSSVIDMDFSEDNRDDDNKSCGETSNSSGSVHADGTDGHDIQMEDSSREYESTEKPTKPVEEEEDSFEFGLFDEHKQTLDDKLSPSKTPEEEEEEEDSFDWALWCSDPESLPTAQDNDGGFTVVKRKERKPKKKMVEPMRRRRPRRRRRRERRRNRYGRRNREDDNKTKDGGEEPVKPANSAVVIKAVSRRHPAISLKRPSPPSAKTSPTAGVHQYNNHTNDINQQHNSNTNIKPNTNNNKQRTDQQLDANSTPSDSGGTQYFVMPSEEFSPKKQGDPTLTSHNSTAGSNSPTRSAPPGFGATNSNNTNINNTPVPQLPAQQFTYPQPQINPGMCTYPPASYIDPALLMNPLLYDPTQLPPQMFDPHAQQPQQMMFDPTATSPSFQNAPSELDHNAYQHPQPLDMSYSNSMSPTGDPHASCFYAATQTPNGLYIPTPEAYQCYSPQEFYPSQPPAMFSPSATQTHMFDPTQQQQSQPQVMYPPQQQQMLHYNNNQEQCCGSPNNFDVQGAPNAGHMQTDVQYWKPFEYQQVSEDVMYFCLPGQENVMLPVNTYPESPVDGIMNLNLSYPANTPVTTHPCQQPQTPQQAIPPPPGMEQQSPQQMPPPTAQQQQQPNVSPPSNTASGLFIPPLQSAEFYPESSPPQKS